MAKIRPTPVEPKGYGEYTAAQVYRWFYSRIELDAETGCWVWTGSFYPNNYGRIFVGKIQEMAHRFSYRVHVMPLPSGSVCVLHQCDNPKCVNPAHLFTGSQNENLADMRAKKRHVYGTRCYNAKLTEKVIPKIRAACARGDGYETVARRYGVSRNAIRQIICGRTWRHVP